MIGLDWSHNKGLAIATEDEIKTVKSIKEIPSGDIALGEETPAKLVYDLIRAGHKVYFVNSKKMKNERDKDGVPKTDETDAIYYQLLGGNGETRLASIDEDRIKLIHSYARYLKTQKKRIAMTNIAKASERYFGDLLNENDKEIDNSTINQYLKTEKELLLELKKICPKIPPELKVKGLGPRIWAGIIAVADPRLFPHQKQYLRYCGLSGMARVDYRFSRKARVVYYLFSESVMKQKDPTLRAIYDTAKEWLINNHDGCTCKSIKGHAHNVGMNRLSTYLAKMIYDKKDFISEGLKQK